jgi:hypothetical protein
MYLASKTILERHQPGHYAPVVNIIAHSDAHSSDQFGAVDECGGKSQAVAARHTSLNSGPQIISQGYGAFDHDCVSRPVETHQSQKMGQDSRTVPAPFSGNLSRHFPSPAFIEQIIYQAQAKQLLGLASRTFVDHHRLRRDVLRSLLGQTPLIFGRQNLAGHPRGSLNY